LGLLLKVLKVGAVWGGSGTLVSRVSNSGSETDPQTEGLATLSLGVLIVPGIRDPETRVPTPLVWDRFREGWFGPPLREGCLGKGRP
jgi:hypothetical protein